MRTLLLLALCALPSWTQIPTIAISKEAPNEAVTTLTFYDGSGNPIYICKAVSRQPTFTWAVTPLANQGTLTNVVVATNVGTVTTSAAHGLTSGNLVWVTGSTTVALNGPYVATVTSTTAFTIVTSGVPDATYATSALAVNSNAPRTTAAQWSIERFTYNVSNAPTADQWASTVTNNQGGSTGKNFICGNRATLAYN